MIPLNECKDGWLYQIDARNAGIGVFCKKEQGFIIARTKFGSTYLFTEYHWDTGAPYGTAKAIKPLCKAPLCDGPKTKLKWLTGKWNELGRQLELEALEQEIKDGNWPEENAEAHRKWLNECWDKREKKNVEKEANTSRPGPVPGGEA